MSAKQSKIREKGAKKARDVVLPLVLGTAKLLNDLRTADGGNIWQGKSSDKQYDLAKILKGIQSYINHPYIRVKDKALFKLKPCAHFGSSRLLFAPAKGRGKDKARANIFIVPSLINGNEIMNILPERSLVKYLAAQGYNVFMVDWGDLAAEDNPPHTLNALLSERLPYLAQQVEKTKQAAGLPVFGLGYCMGGLLLLAAQKIIEAANRNFFKGHILIAVPWDFAAGAAGTLPYAMRKSLKTPVGLAGQMPLINNMPMQSLQLIFAAIDPALMAKKFMAFADMAANTLKARLFVAVEDWLNSGYDLPAPLVKQLTAEWYGANKPALGRWRVGRHPIRADKVHIPCLVIAPEKDKIVPEKSALELYQQLPIAHVLQPACGHISMMVGDGAEKTVWKPISQWIEIHLQRTRMGA